MNKILAAILSISLLVSSVTPSLAQLVPAGRQVVKGLTQSGAKSAAVTAGKALPGKLVQKGVSAAAAHAAAVPVSSAAKSAFPSVSVASPLPSYDVSQLRLNVDRSVRQQLTVSGKEIRALVAAGQTDGLASRILSYPKPSFREGLLRNEFVTVALKGGADKAQVAQAVQFYRTDLANNGGAFAQLPQADLNTLLKIARTPEHPSYQIVSQSQQALSSAAALGLLGGAEDGASLLAFYKRASSSVFKDAAQRIAARGLLRQGAYKELQELAALAKAQGPFWKDVAARAHEKGVQISVADGAVAPSAEDDALAVFLRAGCQPNALNAKASSEATDKWLSLGTPAETASAQKAAAPEPMAALDISLPQVALPAADLNVSPITLPGGTAAAEQPAPAPTQVQQKTVQFFAKSTPSSSSGTLYSGLPVFEAGKLFKKAASWLRGKWGKKEPALPSAPHEEPGLHDDSEIHEVFSNLRSPEAPASADEVMGANETGFIPVSEKGFKLTLVDEQGVEKILPVNLEISNRFRVKGYNRIAFAAHSDFKHGYVAELRNQEQEPLRMAHFYMRLQRNQVGALADLIQATGIEKFNLKLESTPDVVYKSVKLPVYDFLSGKELPLEVEMPVKAYVENAKMVVMENGALGLLKPGATQPTALKGFYVRLPKNQIANFVEVLRFSPTSFNVSVHPTRNRADLIMRDASLTNVSLGKTMGPMVNGSLGMEVSAANSMMFTINYILPGLASLLTPVLKKYGEKKLMVLSLAMSSAAGVLASAGGFYGFVEGLTLGPVSKGLFITALFLMSGSSILKQLVSNMLIRANRGEVILNDAKEAVKASETEFTAEQKHGFAQMGLRLKEFFTKKSEVSLKDVVLYNLSFVYKNVGTLAFLASPYLINHGILLATGVDLGIDYSISFPIYAVYSGVVAWKVWRAKLRDAYSAKNLEQSKKNLELALHSGAKALAGVKGKISSTQIDDAARAFKDALDALVFADVKLNPGQKKADLYAKEKKNFLQKLENKLSNEYAMDPARVKEITGQIKHSLAVQENTLGNILKMLKAPGVLALSSAMTLATVHEFVISSSFASVMKQLINQGELANFLIACSLYVPLIAGRLGGNIISRRISADSMYIFCSALSALGTLVMATAGDSVAQMITGAAVASFGVGNFFTQMYDYIMNKYPKQNRELSSILALTMALGGLGAIPAGYLASMTGFDASSLLYAGAALGASLVLTPGMTKNSTIVKELKYEAKRLWKGVKKLFKRGGKNPPAGNLDDAAPAQ